MPWFWTDDLADLLVEHDGVSPHVVADWRQRPVALAIPEETDPLEFARGMRGTTEGAVA